MSSSSLVFDREPTPRQPRQRKASSEARARKYKYRLTIDPSLQEPIYPDYGVAKLLCEEYGLSDTTIHRFLHGKFRGRGMNLELVKEIRAKARAMTGGRYIYVTRDANGELHFFPFEPRKDENYWYDPLNRYERQVFPEALLPPGANPQWTDRLPTRVQLINTIQPR